MALCVGDLVSSLRCYLRKMAEPSGDLRSLMRGLRVDCGNLVFTFALQNLAIKRK